MSGKTILRLTLALLITLAAAYYQRKTGPTYPLKGEQVWQGINIKYTFARSHGGAGDQPVVVNVSDTTVTARLSYRRFKTDDPWTAVIMKKGGPDGQEYSAAVPHQPTAGKMEYSVLLTRQDQTLLLPEKNSVITRFKGDVPVAILLPHILLMFLAMLFSNAAGLEALANGRLMTRYALWAAIGLFIGGMVLGPLVQKYAFGTFWSGLPVGYDLTDNKTLLAMLAWVVALWKGKNPRSGRVRVIIAAVILLLVFSIPHSMMGSELNYQTMKVQTEK